MIARASRPQRSATILANFEKPRSARQKLIRSLNYHFRWFTARNLRDLGIPAWSSPRHEYLAYRVAGRRYAVARLIPYGERLVRIVIHLDDDPDLPRVAFDTLGVEKTDRYRNRTRITFAPFEYCPITIWIPELIGHTGGHLAELTPPPCGLRSPDCLSYAWTDAAERTRNELTQCRGLLIA